MRGGVLSVIQNSLVGRSLVLSLGLIPLAVGCGDKSTANKSEAAPAPATANAPAGMFPTSETPKLMAVPENRNAVGDRYAEAPRYPTTTGPYPQPKTITDPAVQPAGYATANVPAYSGPMPRPEPNRPVNRAAATVGGGPGLPANPSEQEFTPGIEDLQLFEQPDLDSYGRSTQPPQGWISSSEMLNWKVGQRPRTSPLPHSP